MKALFRKLLIYFSILLLFTILYFLSFNLNLNKITSVYTYKGVFLICIFSIFLLVTLVILKKFLIKSIDIKDIVILVLLFSLIHLLVFCMIPVTIERSFSVFMLSEMSTQDNQTLDLSSVESIFVDKYVKDNSAFDKRFKEQIETGTIQQTADNTYKLTSKGVALVKLFHLFDNLYNVNSNLLK